MTAPANALRRALRDALLADAALTALLGPDKVFDHVPAGAAFPYVTIGATTVLDWSTGTEAGAEHRLALHAWSRQGGHQEAAGIADAVAATLSEAPMVLAGHRLINIRFTTADIGREADARTHHAVIRLRAVTEPL